MSGAVAVIILKEKQLVRHLREAGALTPETARTTAALRIDENAPFRALKRRAVIREPAPGRYYLDEPSWAALQSTRRRMAAVLMIVVLAAVAASLLRLRQP
jgi:hypothetical protein